MEFFTSSRKNVDSPISSFRKADDALMQNAPELLLSDLNGAVCRTTTPLSFDPLALASFLDSDEISSSDPACTWEERIEREIIATRKATAAMAAQLQAKSSALLAEQQNNLLSDSPIISTSTGTNKLTHDEEEETELEALRCDESLHSVSSYELLYQNFQSGDPIAKERFLSFDSKEDIDYAENRDQFFSQQVKRQIVSDIPSNQNAAVVLGDDYCSMISTTASLVISIAPSSPTTITDDVELKTAENETVITDKTSNAAISPCSLKRGGTNDSENTAAVSNRDAKSQSHCVARIRITPTPASYDEKKQDEDIKDCLSATESEVASIDGLPSRLQERWMRDNSARQQMLQNLDGIPPSPSRRLLGLTPRSSRASVPTHPLYNTNNSNNNVVSPHPRLAATVITEEEEEAFAGPYFEPCFQFNLFGAIRQEDLVDELRDSHHDNTKKRSKSSWKTQHDVPMAILDCSNLIHQEDRAPPPVPMSLVRVASTDHSRPFSFAETLPHARVDPRMQDWIAGQLVFPCRPPKDGSFHLGKSRTVIVHEINRGSWTWCTAWSPDGAYLAVATENHQLAVVDTTGSTVWRVRHDRKTRGGMARKSNSTHSIRSIAWGQNYIAIGTFIGVSELACSLQSTGGTGNVVSILSPYDPFSVRHIIPDTGFVGCLDWKKESDVLAMGSRLDFVMIVRICSTVDKNAPTGKRVFHEVLHRIEYMFWVNSVAFSPDGSCLAVGDSGGAVSVYDYEENGTETETNMITSFRRKEALLSVEWSPTGKYLYAGGEDRSVAVIDSTYWEIVHRIGRDRWVQCIASSNGGTHVAVGGVSSEISLLDVENGWDSVMGIELKGLVPLSARWHPKDQYLVVTGQDTSILAVETTNARHVKGHHLHSISPILSIEFSPDGRMVIVGNDAGIVTFFSLSGTSFITAYELVIPFENRINSHWSLDGMFVVVGSKDCVTVVGRKRNKRQGKNCPPNASGFSVKKVIRDLCEVNSVAIDCHSHYVAISGITAIILDVRADFGRIREWKNGPYYANAWSPDGRWLAMMGKEKFLTIYDTSSKRVDHWRAIFSMKCDFVGRALAWGPVMVGGLLYLAYGGESNDIYVMEIRTNEGTWETVLRIPRDGCINVLDWSAEGLLAAGIGNGTVCIIDLAYLQSGVAVNEMDYNWQRQALTCFTEIRRNRGRNSIKSLRWLPAAPGSDRLLAIGGTDGEVEIIDLTERNRCKGYARGP